MNKVRIFDIVIDNMDFNEAIEALKNSLKDDKLTKVFTPNPEIVMEAHADTSLARLINSGDYVFADGIGLVYAANYRNVPLKERVTGYDISIELLKIAEKNNLSVFFLGAEAGVGEKAKARLEASHPKLTIAGVHHGYFNSDEVDEIVKEINDSKADILFVGLGFPKQERWIIDYGPKLTTVKIAIGNGGVIDVLSGNVKRAPDFFIKLNLEWLYRLLSNPKRIKRQLAIPRFMYEVYRDKHAVEKIEE